MIILLLATPGTAVQFARCDDETHLLAEVTGAMHRGALLQHFHAFEVAREIKLQPQPLVQVVPTPAVEEPPAAPTPAVHMEIPAPATAPVDQLDRARELINAANNQITRAPAPLPGSTTAAPVPPASTTTADVLDPVT